MTGLFDPNIIIIIISITPLTIRSMLTIIRQDYLYVACYLFMYFIRSHRQNIHEQ